MDNLEHIFHTEIDSDFTNIVKERLEYISDLKLNISINDTDEIDDKFIFLL